MPEYQSTGPVPGASPRKARVANQFARWWADAQRRFPQLTFLGSLFKPLYLILRTLLRFIAGWYKWAAWERENGQIVSNKAGKPTFSPGRFVRRSLLTAITLLILHIGLSALYYYGTRFQEIVYVTGKQEIVTGELYQFGGCTSLPCSTDSDNGKYYLIETSLYFPRLFYPEENVFANIPQQNAVCNVQGYGWYFRSLRWLYKSAQLYQHIDGVSCRPFTDQELQRALAGGAVG